jgi:hypothetical protein
VWWGGCGGIFDWCWRGGYTAWLWPSLLYSWGSAWAYNSVPAYSISVTNQIAEYGYPASYAYGNAVANAEQGTDNWSEFLWLETGRERVAASRPLALLFADASAFSALLHTFLFPL